ncbi:FXL17-like protein, partial [Mya arenaria]
EQQFENYRNLYEELEEHDAVNFDTFVVENLSNKPTLSQSSSISSINQRFESCPIDCLPDEIMVKIFSHLSTKDLCLSCALVCGRWRNLTLDHSLWLELDFRHCPNLPTIQFLRIVRKAPLLRRLFISDRTNLYPPELAIVLESCPHLCEIDIGFCDKITCELINCLASYAQNLTHINVEGCNYFDEGCVENLVKLKRLSHLNLSHCTAIQDQGLMLVAKRLEKIVNINLDGMNFITDSIQHIAECRCLKHLAMSFCESLTDRSLEYIRKCVNLEYLRLRKGSDFTTEGLTRFFTTVKLVHLQVLNLSECTAINDAVVLNIVQIWCWDITDTGLISIVDHCGRLEQLDLVGLDKIRGECLTRISEEMPRLIFLDLRQCNK